MFIKSISLKNYRNYTEADFTFEQGGCIITGDNGIGKTNLLEAITYFTYGKSVLNQKDTQLINHTKDHFFLKSTFVYSNQETEFKVYYDNEKKVIKKDDYPVNRLSDLYSMLQTVYSSPNDVYNIFHLPAKRRHFIDIAISKLHPLYIDHIRNYKHILSQRNSLLKTDYDVKEKEAWDRVFAEESCNITRYRQRFFETYKPFFKEAYKLIVKEKEDINISLKLNFYDVNFVPKMIETLSEIAPKERKYQKSMIGSHLDDFHITLNKQDATHFASQGQKRSIVLALKLALSNMITATNKVNPIIIFDDTLAELDTDRTASLLKNLTNKHQIFIATPTIDKYKGIDLPLLHLE
jgi:DNA replication and repair protein RecF